MTDESTESVILETLDDIEREGEAECRLCGHVVEGENLEQILDGLADHGEDAHEWDIQEGWVR